MPPRGTPEPHTSARASILPAERRRLIAARLRQHGSISVAELEAEFGISPMTARRDLDELERRGVARRTHGGAVLPALSRHEDSFLQRIEIAVDAKERLADAGDQADRAGRGDLHRQLDHRLRGRPADRPREPAMHAADELRPGDGADERVRRAAGRADRAGGTLRKRTRSFVGPQAVRAIELALRRSRLFSVRGVTRRLPHGPGPARGRGQAVDDRPREERGAARRRDQVRSPRAEQITTIDDVGVMLAADVDESAADAAASRRHGRSPGLRRPGDRRAGPGSDRGALHAPPRLCSGRPTASPRGRAPSCPARTSRRRAR